MVNNLRIRKKLMELGITTVALVHGALGLGCSEAIASEEDVKEIVSMVESEYLKEANLVANKTILQDTPDPTDKPTSTEEENLSDPYILTDEEAIEMGTYIYDNYIKKYIENEVTFLYECKSDSELEDIINYVCLVNQKYPALYPDRPTSCNDGSVYWYLNICEYLSNANFYEAAQYERPNLIPFSIFMKEGRPEKKMLEEIESDFSHLLNDEVTDEEIYEYWGKVIKMSINLDETFKDWHSFNAILLYYTLYDQIGCFLMKPQNFNYIEHNCIPASYVFDNRSGNLDLYDAIYYISTTTKEEYASLTDEEYNLYRGCFAKLAGWFEEENVDNDNYIKERKKSSN